MVVTRSVTHLIGQTSWPPPSQLPFGPSLVSSTGTEGLVRNASAHWMHLPIPNQKSVTMRISLSLSSTRTEVQVRVQSTRWTNSASRSGLHSVVRSGLYPVSKSGLHPVSRSTIHLTSRSVGMGIERKWLCVVLRPRSRGHPGPGRVEGQCPDGGGGAAPLKLKRKCYNKSN